MLREGKHEMSPMMAPTFCLVALSDTNAGRSRELQAESIGPAKLKRQRPEFQEAKAAET